MGFVKGNASGIAAMLFAACFVAPVFGKANAEEGGATSPEMAATVQRGSDSRLDLPEVLSPEDVRLYRQIFALQEDGHWKDADHLIKKLNDKILLGHTLAQRFLHPTKYRTSYKELKAWMAKYADHPDARRLYKLALRRKPKNWRAPRPPVRHFQAALPKKERTEGAEKQKEIAAPPPPKKRLNRRQKLQARAYKRQIRRNIRSGWTKAVKQLLLSPKIKQVFSDLEYDRARARLGAGYFADGRDEWALEWAGGAADRSGNYIAQAYWTAGLAAWRLERFDVAGSHFEQMTRSGDASPWTISAAAFWAARAHLVNRRPDQVSRWLNKAAEYPRTFYGILARHLLARPNNFKWDQPPLEDGAVGSIEKVPAGQRAMALIQVERDRRAERELRTVATSSGGDMAHGILALASRSNMASLSMRLDEMLFVEGEGYDGAAYPLPKWTPKDGFRVDRALIYALIRQESRFNPKAKSWAGAHGLMQLMPRTASFVARDRRYRWSKKRRLFEPETNLSLGQKYIEILLEDGKIDGGLFLMAAAWNGGPGNLAKWRRKVNDMGDPLFFIESLPSRETRVFIERVFTNLWIYRNRLGQPTPSLDAVAAGKWPAYVALDKSSVRVADNGEN
jgi:soluble lytic murein transglycosylase